MMILLNWYVLCCACCCLLLVVDFGLVYDMFGLDYFFNRALWWFCRFFNSLQDYQVMGFECLSPIFGKSIVRGEICKGKYFGHGSQYFPVHFPISSLSFSAKQYRNPISSLYSRILPNLCPSPGGPFAQDICPWNLFTYSFLIGD